MISEASVHVYVALRSTEGEVSELGVISEDINEGEGLDMGREYPLK